MDEPSMGDVNFIEDNLLDQSKELYLTELYLDKTPLRSFFFLGDVLMGSVVPSIKLIDSICTELVDLTPISSPLVSVTSHLHAFHESLGNIRGFPPPFDSCYAYLEDMP